MKIAFFTKIVRQIEKVSLKFSVTNRTSSVKQRSSWKDVFFSTQLLILTHEMKQAKYTIHEYALCKTLKQRSFQSA